MNNQSLMSNPSVNNNIKNYDNSLDKHKNQADFHRIFYY